MTQVYFKLETEDIQSLIDHSVKGNAGKQFLQTVFNNLMEVQRAEYIQATSYEHFI